MFCEESELAMCLLFWAYWHIAKNEVFLFIKSLFCFMNFLIFRYNFQINITLFVAFKRVCVMYKSGDHDLCLPSLHVLDLLTKAILKLSVNKPSMMCNVVEESVCWILKSRVSNK